MDVIGRNMSYGARQKSLLFGDILPLVLTLRENCV